MLRLPLRAPPRLVAARATPAGPADLAAAVAAAAAPAGASFVVSPPPGVTSELNSICVVGDGDEAAVCVLNAGCTIDLRAAAAALGWATARLAPRGRFPSPPGTVPPVGHGLRTVLDVGVVAEDSPPALAGAGAPSPALLLLRRPASLAAVAGVTVARLVAAPYTLPGPPVLVADRAALAAAFAALAPPARAPPTLWPVGVDAEWRPETAPRVRHPVAVLQLATRGAAFVVDVQTLTGASPPAAPGAPPPAPPPADQAAAAADLRAGLDALAADPRVALVGHSHRQDLARLARTLHSVAVAAAGDGDDPPAFFVPTMAATAVDVAALARWAAAPDTPPNAYPPRLRFGGSLAALTSLYLGTHLSKGARLTDWAARPLSEEQVAYAARDAHAAVSLHDALNAAVPRVLESVSGRASVNGGVTEAAGGFRPQVERRGVARGAARPLASGASSAPRRGWGGRLSSTADDEPCRRPPPGAHAADLDLDLEALLSHLGTPLPAGGRAAAVAAAANLAPGAPPPRADRGGVVRLADACLLLVNLDPDGVAAGPYPNAFSVDADASHFRLAWFPGPGQTDRHPTIARLLDPGEPVLLFARLARGGGRSGSPFVLLGRADDPVVAWAADGRGGGEFGWRLPDLRRAAAVQGRGGAVDALLRGGRLDLGEEFWTGGRGGGW